MQPAEIVTLVFFVALLCFVAGLQASAGLRNFVLRRNRELSEEVSRLRAEAKDETDWWMR